MISENKNLYMDMVQMMMRATDSLVDDGVFSDKDKSFLKGHLSAMKSYLYSKDSFKDIYIKYCKDSVRLIG